MHNLTFKLAQVISGNHKLMAKDVWFLLKLLNFTLSIAGNHNLCQRCIVLFRNCWIWPYPLPEITINGKRKMYCTFLESVEFDPWHSRKPEIDGAFALNYVGLFSGKNFRVPGCYFRRRRVSFNYVNGNKTLHWNDKSFYCWRWYEILQNYKL